MGFGVLGLEGINPTQSARGRVHVYMSYSQDSLKGFI